MHRDGATIRAMSKAERPSEMKRQAGLRLRAAREHLQLNQENMANMLGCTRTALTNWENGDRLPDVAAMVRLYQRTGITLEWIYAGSLREMNYDKSADLERLAGENGAVVGAPVAEMAAEVARRSGIAASKPPARAPSRRSKAAGWLHEKG
jgi:transcriptional regulator with XRE-family HTH domain